MITFEPFPKLARLSRGCVITEKLDGTNAQVIIKPLSYAGVEQLENSTVARVVGEMMVAAGSRTRLISPGKDTDNYGFAAWVFENADELVKLGEGRHFGEWYGQGIQRKYGLTERRFALFNPERFPPARPMPSCVSVVPVLWKGEFSSYAVNSAMRTLEDYGSLAVPGFMDPEGIVIYHEAARCSFKKTFDDGHKEAA